LASKTKKERELSINSKRGLKKKRKKKSRPCWGKKLSGEGKDRRCSLCFEDTPKPNEEMQKTFAPP